MCYCRLYFAKTFFSFFWHGPCWTQRWSAHENLSCRFSRLKDWLFMFHCWRWSQLNLWNIHVILMENEGNVKVTNYALKLLLQVKVIHPMLQVKLNILLLVFSILLLSLSLIFASISHWRKEPVVQFFSPGLGLLMLCNGEAKPSKNSFFQYRSQLLS